jgi:2'-5' RNA ligase
VQMSETENEGCCLVISVPPLYAAKFPDPEMHNRGYPPHLTVLYVASEMSDGDASTVLYLARQVAKKIPPFRVFMDAQGGLQTFGDGEDGEKAMWIAARSDPRGELERYHRMLRQTLEAEGIEVQAHPGFTPHVTWSYVPNDVSEDEVRRMDQHVSDRFPWGCWFDVRHIEVDMPDGSTKIAALSPVPKRR